MLQVAQGAMQQIGNILTQLKQIATEAASANDGSNLTSLDDERSALETQIDNINSSTTYSGSGVFGSGNTAAVTDTPSTGLDAVNVSGFSGNQTDVYTLSATATSVTLTNTSQGGSQKILSVAPTGLNTSTLNFSQYGISITVNKNQASLAGTISVTRGAGNLTFQAGDEATTANQVTLTLGDVDHSTLGLSGDLTSQLDAQNYMGAVDTAISALNNDESAVGDAQNQLSYQTANLQTMQTNTQAAESTIKDTNYASAMSTFTSSQIATQADVAMLSQANSLPQQILSLIKQG
jgi:flagellin